MELPVLKDKAAPLLWDLMRLFHQTETRWTEHVAEATMLHLDDPRWDALLSLHDGVPGAYAGVLAAGRGPKCPDPSSRNLRQVAVEACHVERAA
jgi:hypothetical protein